MAFWMSLWEVVFIVTVVGFGLMSVWVTIQGARDIKSLMQSLRGRHERGELE